MIGLSKEILAWLHRLLLQMLKESPSCRQVELLVSAGAGDSVSIAPDAGVRFSLPFLRSIRKMTPETEEDSMEQQPARKCPECGSADYVFRGRKKIAATAEKGEPEQWETKRACRACGHTWKEREPKQE
jgi:DNA-directed RNA polymerase subunit M/transcription elongation factor TFIIS